MGSEENQKPRVNNSHNRRVIEYCRVKEEPPKFSLVRQVLKTVLTYRSLHSKSGDRWLIGTYSGSDDPGAYYKVLSTSKMMRFDTPSGEITKLLLEYLTNHYGFVVPSYTEYRKGIYMFRIEGFNENIPVRKY